MLSKIKKLGECERELEIEIPAEDVKREFKKILSQYSQRVKVKGFRKGKTPEAIVKRIYLPEIKESVIQAIAPQAIHNELKTQKINPVSTPVINEIDFKEEEALRFKAQFEVWPEFELPSYRRIKVKMEKKTVTSEDVNQSLEDLREKSAQYVSVEGRNIKDGDYVVAEVKGKDIQAKKLLPTEKVVVLAGHPDNEEILNKNLLGMKSDDGKDFEIFYPNDHKNKKLAGKKIAYHLEVLSIKERKLPEINDGFAKSLGKFENLEELRAEIKKALVDSWENTNQRELSNEILKKITDKVNFELPESLVRRETANRLQQMLLGKPMEKVNREEVRTLQEEAKKKAVESLRNNIILNKIAEKEKIEVSEEELSEEMRAIAKANRLSLAQVVDAVNKEESYKQDLRQTVRLRKTVDFLIKHAIIKY